MSQDESILNRHSIKMQDPAYARSFYINSLGDKERYLKFLRSDESCNASGTKEVESALVREEILNLESMILRLDSRILASEI